MVTKVYNKAVRDGMKRIIAQDGNKATFKGLPASEWRAALGRKLVEEATEYDEDGSLAELADVYEVLKALAVYHGGLSEVMVEAARKERERGAFHRHLFLVSVDFPELFDGVGGV